MSVYNQNRGGIIQIIIGTIFFLIVAQLVSLQVVSNKYKLAADNNAIFRKIIYPDRGIIYDRKKRALLENTISYDLVVIPNEAKGVDTAALCAILQIDKAEYSKRIVEAIIKNTRVKAGVFEPFLTPELYAQLNENLYRFPGFSLSERSIRSYPYNTAAHVLGYVAEVDVNFLKKHESEGYEMGDYAGMTGLEKNYETVLMGQRGVKRFLRDNKGKIQGPYEKGEFDTVAIAGKNLYTSVDVQVQQLAEKLLQNKIGSAVAINPKTGGVIAMASSPGYNPNLLTGSKRRKTIGRLLLDTARPIYNRAIKGQYPPGSTFKPLGALIALDEGLITPNFGYNCFGSYGACGDPRKCEHHNAGHAANLQLALAYSCNSYFLQVFRMAIDNPKYASAKGGYVKWKEYMNAFGFGRKLGVDLPSENKANIPDTAQYNKDFGNPRYWNSCYMLTLGIGQDRMTATPLQLANSMAFIANDGYYYTPHFVDSIESETQEEAAQLAPFRKKQKVTKIPKEYFDVIKEGMHDVTVYGTAAFIKVPGHEYCAKTGTAQNPHGKNHSLFVCFAPKDNPKIAVAVIVENAGYGSTWAGPIGGLLMEQYLNDTLTTESQLKADNLAQVDLMPQAIKNWYAQNNKSAYLTPIEYNNDELSDVWDMEMLAEGVVKTKTKDTAPTAPLPNTDKTNKDSLLPNTDKKKKLNP
ncbi:MAG: penicillin-binding protein 2 [Chitinophagaceae bacterium]|jgi:penicillin-binding protein 2|nr:penicillin-binding protein 2 [Chitinophagaceae bacterium]MCF8289809.1 penicillin-binding protein 2 [Chitinophagaceae bacterium]MCF8422399.1 penicillin-binding protein 2 [Chitinophagaceae bacterium]